MRTMRYELRVHEYFKFSVYSVLVIRMDTEYNGLSVGVSTSLYFDLNRLDS